MDLPLVGGQRCVPPLDEGCPRFRSHAVRAGHPLKLSARGAGADRSAIASRILGSDRHAAGARPRRHAAVLRAARPGRRERPLLDLQRRRTFFPYGKCGPARCRRTLANPGSRRCLPGVHRPRAKGEPVPWFPWLLVRYPPSSTEPNGSVYSNSLPGQPPSRHPHVPNGVALSSAMRLWSQVRSHHSAPNRTLVSASAEEAKQQILQILQMERLLQQCVGTNLLRKARVRGGHQNDRRHRLSAYCRRRPYRPRHTRAI